MNTWILIVAILGGAGGGGGGGGDTDGIGSANGGNGGNGGNSAIIQIDNYTESKCEWAADKINKEGKAYAVCIPH